MRKDKLGDRMKAYENVNRLYLPRRMPVIIRIDGKAFHSFTRGFKKPFDTILISSMQETAKRLCKAIEGCQLAYVQSDEISLLLTDYATKETQAWFDKNLQKMVSVSASIATMAFNAAFEEAVNNAIYKAKETGDDAVFEHMKRAYLPKINTATFDARAFVLPKEEVCNYFIWRQQDATRNSIQMVGYANFSQRELHKVNCSQIQDMLFTIKGINWNDFPTAHKRGACIIKEHYYRENAERTRWVVDHDTPVFTKDRSYIEKYVYIAPELRAGGI